MERSEGREEQQPLYNEAAPAAHGKSRLKLTLRTALGSALYCFSRWDGLINCGNDFMPISSIYFKCDTRLPPKFANKASNVAPVETNHLDLRFNIVFFIALF